MSCAAQAYSQKSSTITDNSAMGIAKYIKEIGRGKDGARALAREQAADLMGQVLDGQVTDLEIGGFCLAMRIKGETPEEMAGFLDAVHARLSKVPAQGRVVVIPTYNGARRLPVLTPLLGALLAREGASRGFGVLLHGCTTEDTRVSSQSVLDVLNLMPNKPLGQYHIAQAATECIAPGSLHFASTEQLNPALKRLLDVRRAVGLRNPAHSLVKLMNPSTSAQALVVSSYTHPEYLQSMTATFALTGAHAMLLRGTEGEAVADARRAPQMDGFVHGVHSLLAAVQAGSVHALPDLPKTTDAASTATYIDQVLQGQRPVPTPIASQVEHILHLLEQIQNQ
jgi:anthranilate phosphoribosyltransferase